MAGTAYYFHMVITSLLDIVLETVIEHASQYLVTGISPSPSPTTASRDLVGTASTVPVNRILQADGRPPNGDSSDDFLGSSLHVDEILHKASCENPCEFSHGGELPRSHPSFQQYIVTWHAQADLHYMGAGHKMPAHLPYVLQRALLMSNQCERAVHLLKRSVEMVTKLIDPGVKVHWLIVIPRRRLQLVFPDEPGSSSHRHIAAAHTVLLIRSPLAGNFVVDPTAEQYGYPREHRFLAWEDYKELYVAKSSEWVGQGVWSTEHRWEEVFNEGTVHPGPWWVEVGKVVHRCVDDWVGNMLYQRTLLREAMDDEWEYPLYEIELRLDVEHEMDRIRHYMIRERR